MRSALTRAAATRSFSYPPGHISPIQWEYEKSTISSSSTVPGPGALTGRAVKALGEVTLRGFGHLVMLKHFSSMTHSFPHTDEQASHIKNVSELYGDLLEFARVDLYSGDILQKSLRIILTQIGMQQLIRTNSLLCQVILDVGFLDILVELCHTSELGPTKSTSMLDHNPHTPSKHLLIACNMALLDILAYPEYREYVASHPIYSIWPKIGCRSSSPGDLLPKLIFLDEYTNISLEDYTAYLNLSLEAACALPCVTKVPPDKLLNSLRTEATHRHAVKVFISRSPISEKVSFLSTLIEYMLCWLDIVAEYHDHSEFSITELEFFLNLMTEIAKQDCDNKQALIDAGVMIFLTQAMSSTKFSQHVNDIDLGRTPQALDESVDMAAGNLEEKKEAVKNRDEMQPTW
ncbi:hypothetical protein BDQ12DRAFT_731921 [Crucibulum laeve]|uniref:Uncharacterized protein n=1 Tax=Crucibulum laeve TaxID=68775 RepID=A0A5C3MGD8_9AGAR|nr:hypothetical protein BDQ12DRAFT_731921 [Crucibulum laeve]